MKTPYQILDLAVESNDVEIKQAYLRQIKENPPDRDQHVFQLIHNAYTLIKDKNSRVKHALFTLPTANFEELIDQALHADMTPEFTSENFNKLLRASIDGSAVFNSIVNAKK
jgi:DnaJ-class molecular chaperone